MFIVWGKSVKRRSLGYVADYCHLCRDLRAFEVQRVGLASHVYYISFGEGELQGYDRSCEECGSAFETVPDRYRGMSKVVRSPQDLVGETFPDIYNIYREQLDIDRKVRDTPSLLTPNERRTRMLEPMAIKAHQVQQKLSSLQMDWQVGLALAAAVPIIWIFVAIEEKIRAEDAVQDLRWFMAGLFISLGIIGWKLIGASRRYVLKHAAPQLASALAPLRPAEGELTEVLDQLKAHKLKLGSKLTAADLLGKIEQARLMV